MAVRRWLSLSSKWFNIAYNSILRIVVLFGTTIFFVLQIAWFGDVALY